MTVRECYEMMGGDYEEVCGRLMSEERIQRFAVKFLADKSYAALNEALEAGNMEDAFRAAHTMKGVCQNLSFTRLFVISNDITELLRPRETVDLSGKLAELKEVYDLTISAIEQLAAGAQ